MPPAAAFGYYMNLPAGDYVFRIITGNNDGVWHTAGTSVAFTIVPNWHDTWRFRVLVEMVVLGLLTAAYRLRVWRLHERQRTRKLAQGAGALRNANAELKRVGALDGLARIANHGAFSPCERPWTSMPRARRHWPC